jgi:hypothetical protein
MRVNCIQNQYIRNADIIPNRNDMRSTAYMNELPKIFEPPFGLTPKILSCSLRLTKKSNRNKITKLRIAQRMLSEIFSQAEMDIKENYARRGFSVAQKLSSLRSSPFGSCNRWICDSLSLVQICSASLRKLHISPKTLGETAINIYGKKTIKNRGDGQWQSYT